MPSLPPKHTWVNTDEGVE
ncbi:MAG: hypothetical protein CMC35_06685 [Flavobacteriaceae bacterium]|nr:hypothetical protein [Flavobacteriaceae bacterium]